MRRAGMAALISLALVLAAVPGGAAAAEAETIHGLFVGGEGANSNVPGPLDLGASGSWSVLVRDGRAQVTGNLSALHGPCAQAPCEFTIALKWIPFTGGWDADDGAWVFTATDWPFGPTSWDFVLEIDPAGPAFLHADITGCPYGWTSWTIEGVVLS